jgi:hypothetical protein
MHRSVLRAVATIISSARRQQHGGTPPLHAERLRGIVGRMLPALHSFIDFKQMTPTERLYSERLDALFSLKQF